MIRVNKVCGLCASKEVVRDAWAEWDTELQAWVLKTFFDSGFCESCETTSDDLIVDEPIKENTNDDRSENYPRQHQC